MVTIFNGFERSDMLEIGKERDVAPWLERSLMVRWIVESIPPDGMCYPVCGMMHIKEPMLLIRKSSTCGGSGFPLSLFLSASLNKTFPSFLNMHSHTSYTAEHTQPVHSMYV